MAAHRIGIVGIENTHADGIVRALNVDGVGDARVTALVAGDPDRTAALAELGGIERVASESTELIGEVDALIVTTRDGATHRALAVPFLEEGVPVWVDKPLALSVADAEAILAAAGSTPVTSSSTLRWLPDTDAAAAALASIGELQSLTLTGPADPEGPYGGLFFYGIHLVDVAQRLVPGMPTEIDVERSSEGVRARYVVGGVAVTLDFVRPVGEVSVPFHVTAVGTRATESRDIVLGADYVRPGVEAFVRMLETRVLPVPPTQMRAAIAILSVIGAG
ncbi:Gfo/Idh/MocA family oxidoreductase [Microbacterium sp. NPDC090003]|uniref:Gfo/Idh/MocA family oxidoreductase n=1 Tax=Microbacterium sp. NPDC090003 TaxID=3364203 RepID=UPI0037F7CA42